MAHQYGLPSQQTLYISCAPCISLVKGMLTERRLLAAVSLRAAIY
jgi:hypothetical protein